MNPEDLVIKLEANSDIETGYMLLPYIKVNEEETFLNTQIANDSILYVPIGDSFINEQNGFVGVNNESDILNDHNYHYNTMNDSDKCENIGLFCGITEENLKKQQCSLCNKVLANPAALVRHYRIHTGEQPFQCQLCLKRFTQQSNLWKHVLIHTGERKFSCKFCDKKFSQRANMEKHVRIHTGEKPYVCPVCERGFTQRANLTKHQRTHTGEKPYACKYCSRTFAQLSNKQKHEILHKGIKPFSCPVCLVAFTQQSNLKKHIATHGDSDEATTCKTCNKTYFKRKNYMKHKQECHSLQFVKNKSSVMNNVDKMGGHSQRMVCIKSEADYCDIMLADE